MLGLPFDEQVFLNDARFMHYSTNKKRIIIRDDKLCRQYYNDLGDVNHIHVLLPGELLKVFLQSLYETAGKHPVISKMMQKNDKSNTSLQLQHTSETRIVIVKYAFKINA